MVLDQELAGDMKLVEVVRQAVLLQLSLLCWPKQDENRAVIQEQPRNIDQTVQR